MLSSFLVFNTLLGISSRPSEVYIYIYIYICISDKIKHKSFQAVVMSVLLYGCTTWMLTKCIEKKLDRNHTRMLRPILNKSWKKDPTKQLRNGNRPSISKTI